MVRTCANASRCAFCACELTSDNIYYVKYIVGQGALSTFGHMRVDNVGQVAEGRQVAKEARGVE